MDRLLKLAAEASHEVSLAEQALAEQSYTAAREAIDRVDDRLGELRTRWPDMSARERKVIGAAAATVRARRDEVGSKVPSSRAVSEAEATVDREQEVDPGDDFDS